MPRERKVDWDMVIKLKEVGLSWKKIKEAIDYPCKHESLARNYNEFVTEKDVSSIPFRPVVFEPVITEVRPPKPVWCDYSTENLTIKPTRLIDCRFMTATEATSLFGNSSAMCLEG